MRNKFGHFLKGSKPTHGFKKGIKVWNKNKKGIHLSLGSEFKKGMTPWNKGTRGLVKPNKGNIKKGEHLNKKTEFQKGQKPRNWKGGRRNVSGYIYIFSPEHPTKNTNKLVAEHRLTMEKHIGRFLKESEIVHHIDGDRKNNSISNLMLFPNSSSHHKFHHYGDHSFICKFCKRNQKEI